MRNNLGATNFGTMNSGQSAVIDKRNESLAETVLKKLTLENARLGDALHRIGCFTDRMIGSVPASTTDSKNPEPHCIAAQLDAALNNYSSLIKALFSQCSRIEQIG